MKKRLLFLLFIPFLVTAQDRSPSKEDRLQLDIQLLTVQVTSLKEYTLALQVTNRELTAENAELKKQIKEGSK